MVHVANAEGHRKMLAFQPPNPLPSTQSSSSFHGANNNNLSHILINTITKKFGTNEDGDSLGSTVVLKNNQNATVGPFLPTYKSNSLNLSCIIEEEPPPGMMMSHIRETTTNSSAVNEDPNANLSTLISDPNLNPSSSSSTSTTLTTTTVISSSQTSHSHHGNHPGSTLVHTEKVVLTKVCSGSSGSKKRSNSGSPTFSPEKVIQTHLHESCPSPSSPVPSSGGAGATTDKSKPQQHHPDQVESRQQKGNNGAPFSPSSPQCQKGGNANATAPDSSNNGGNPGTFMSIPTNCPSVIPNEDPPGLKETSRDGDKESPLPDSALLPQKHGKSINGTKNVCLKR